MKHKFYFLLASVFLLLSSCAIDYQQYESYSKVLFLKNTLEYPILVQSYFKPFNNDSLWYEKEQIAWEEPVELQPNERKVIMDFVPPTRIKIFRSSDNSLLLDIDNLDCRADYAKVSDNALQYSEQDEKELGVKRSKVTTYKLAYDLYYLKDNRYLSENILWDVYPIYFIYYQNFSDRLSDMDNIRKSLYKDQTNGAALITALILNKNAACFAQ